MTAWRRAAGVAVVLVAFALPAVAEATPAPLRCGDPGSLTAAKVGEVRPLPAAPRISALTLAISYGGYADLAVTSDAAVDATLIIRIPGVPEVVVYPDAALGADTRRCVVRLPDLALGNAVDLEVTATAPGGGTSPPVVRRVAVEHINEPHVHCGYPSTLLLVPVLLTVGLVLVPVVALVSWLVRKPKSAAFEATPIALLAIEPLARRARMRAGIGGACALGAAIALWQADAAVLAGVSAVIAALAVRRSRAARAMLVAIESHAAREARATDERVFVLTDNRAYDLAVAPSALAIARRNAIPRSQLVLR